MSTGRVQPPVVIDWDVFDQLVRETSQHTAVAFITTFIELLPQRSSMLIEAVQAEHHEDALVALFSIRSGALMLGMHRLAAATGTVLAELSMSPARWVAVSRISGTPLTSGLDEIVAALDIGLTTRTQPSDQSRPPNDVPGEDPL